MLEVVWTDERVNRLQEIFQELSGQIGTEQFKFFLQETLQEICLNVGCSPRSTERRALLEMEVAVYRNFQWGNIGGAIADAIASEFPVNGVHLISCDGHEIPVKYWSE